MQQGGQELSGIEQSDMNSICIDDLSPISLGSFNVNNFVLTPNLLLHANDSIKSDDLDLSLLGCSTDDGSIAGEISPPHLKSNAGGCDDVKQGWNAAGGNGTTHVASLVLSGSQSHPQHPSTSYCEKKTAVCSSQWKNEHASRVASLEGRQLLHAVLPSSPFHEAQELVGDDSGHVAHYFTVRNSSLHEAFRCSVKGKGFLACASLQKALFQEGTGQHANSEQEFDFVPLDASLLSKNGTNDSFKADTCSGDKRSQVAYCQGVDGSRCLYTDLNKLCHHVELGEKTLPDTKSRESIEELPADAREFCRPQNKDKVAETNAEPSKCSRPGDRENVIETDKEPNDSFRSKNKAGIAELESGAVVEPANKQNIAELNAGLDSVSVSGNKENIKEPVSEPSNSHRIKEKESTSESKPCYCCRRERKEMCQVEENSDSVVSRSSFVKSHGFQKRQKLVRQKRLISESDSDTSEDFKTNHKKCKTVSVTRETWGIDSKSPLPLRRSRRICRRRFFLNITDSESDSPKPAMKDQRRPKKRLSSSFSDCESPVPARKSKRVTKKKSFSEYIPFSDSCEDDNKGKNSCVSEKQHVGNRGKAPCLKVKETEIMKATSALKTTVKSDNQPCSLEFVPVAQIVLHNQSAETEKQPTCTEIHKNVETEKQTTSTDIQKNAKTGKQTTSTDMKKNAETVKRTMSTEIPKNVETENQTMSTDVKKNTKTDMQRDAEVEKQSTCTDLQKNAETEKLSTSADIQQNAKAEKQTSSTDTQKNIHQPVEALHSKRKKKSSTIKRRLVLHQVKQKTLSGPKDVLMEAGQGNEKQDALQGGKTGTANYVSAENTNIVECGQKLTLSQASEMEFNHDSKRTHLAESLKPQDDDKGKGNTPSGSLKKQTEVKDCAKKVLSEIKDIEGQASCSLVAETFHSTPKPRNSQSDHKRSISKSKSSGIISVRKKASKLKCIKKSHNANSADVISLKRKAMSVQDSPKGKSDSKSQFVFKVKLKEPVDPSYKHKLRKSGSSQITNETDQKENCSDFDDFVSKTEGKEHKTSASKVKRAPFKWQNAQCKVLETHQKDDVCTKKQKVLLQDNKGNLQQKKRNVKARPEKEASQKADSAAPDVSQPQTDNSGKKRKLSDVEAHECSAENGVSLQTLETRTDHGGEINNPSGAAVTDSDHTPIENSLSKQSTSGMRNRGCKKHKKERDSMESPDHGKKGVKGKGNHNRHRGGEEKVYNFLTLAKAIATEADAILFCQQYGLLPQSHKCPMCGALLSKLYKIVRTVKTSSVEFRFQCNRKTCKSRSQIPVRSAHWFSKSTSIQCCQHLLIFYLFSNQFTTEQAVEESEVSCEGVQTDKKLCSKSLKAVRAETVQDLYNFCREVCVLSLPDPEPIGGRNCTVVILEAQFGKTKHCSRRFPEGQFVLGAFCRQTDVVFFVPVPALESKHVIPVIERYIKKGTEVQTDNSDVYKKLGTLGYKHVIMNHHQHELDKETGRCLKHNKDSIWWVRKPPASSTKKASSVSVSLDPRRASSSSSTSQDISALSSSTSQDINGSSPFTSLSSKKASSTAGRDTKKTLSPSTSMGKKKAPSSSTGMGKKKASSSSSTGMGKKVSSSSSTGMGKKKASSSSTATGMGKKKASSSSTATGMGKKKASSSSSTGKGKKKASSSSTRLDNKKASSSTRLDTEKALSSSTSMDISALSSSTSMDTTAASVSTSLYAQSRKSKLSSCVSRSVSESAPQDSQMSHTSTSACGSAKKKSKVSTPLINSADTVTVSHPSRSLDISSESVMLDEAQTCNVLQTSSCKSSASSLRTGSSSLSSGCGVHASHSTEKNLSTDHTGSCCSESADVLTVSSDSGVNCEEDSWIFALHMAEFLWRRIHRDDKDIFLSFLQAMMEVFPLEEQ